MTSYLFFVFLSIEQSSLAGKFSTYKHSLFHVLVKEFRKCVVRRVSKGENGVLKIEVNKDVGGRQSLGLGK